jgi:hypothetical protein
MDAGHEAAGLRGGYAPVPCTLTLLRDATLSRDALSVMQVLVAHRLRDQVETGAPVVVIAASTPPTAHTAALRRLGCSAAAVRRIVFIDARAPKCDALNESSACGADSERGVVMAVTRALRLGNGALVAVDCADALRLGIACDATAVVRAALSFEAGVLVCADSTVLPLTTSLPFFAVSKPLYQLEELASIVIDVVPLSAATEYQGRVCVQKVAGRWWRRPSRELGNVSASDKSIRRQMDNVSNIRGSDAGTFLYNLGDTSVRYYR